jgi:hypothetical protein
VRYRSDVPEETPSEPHSTQPRAGLLCLESDAPLLLEQLDELGYEVQMLPTADALSFGLVDIGGDGADLVIADLSAVGTRVIAFGVDPDDIAQIRTKALGASVIVSRDALLSDLAAYVPMVV